MTSRKRIGYKDITISNAHRLHGRLLVTVCNREGVGLTFQQSCSVRHRSTNNEVAIGFSMDPKMVHPDLCF